MFKLYARLYENRGGLNESHNGLGRAVERSVYIPLLWYRVAIVVFTRPAVIIKLRSPNPLELKHIIYVHNTYRTISDGFE